MSKGLIVRAGYVYSGNVFVKWFSGRDPLYTSSETNAFENLVKDPKGKECSRLFVNNFDIVDAMAHREFTDLFCSFGDLLMDSLFDVDVNGNPFAIVHFQFKEDAMRCFDQHNYSYGYLRFRNKMLFVDYDRDLNRTKTKKIQKSNDNSDADLDHYESYKKLHFKSL